MEHLRKPDPPLAEQMLLFPAEARSSSRDHVTSSHKEQCHLYQDRKCFNFMWSTHVLHFSSLALCARDTCRDSAWILWFLVLRAHCAVTLNSPESLFTPPNPNTCFGRTFLTKDRWHFHQRPGLHGACSPSCGVGSH